MLAKTTMNQLIDAVIMHRNGILTRAYQRLRQFTQPAFENYKTDKLQNRRKQNETNLVMCLVHETMLENVDLQLGHEKLRHFFLKSALPRDSTSSESRANMGGGKFSHRILIKGLVECNDDGKYISDWTRTSAVMHP
jgi:hypothetical protein